MGLLSLQVVAIGWLDCLLFDVPFFFSAVCSVVRLAVVWIIHHLFGLLFGFLASCRVPNRVGKVMFSCINKFGNSGVRIACFCVQGAHIVECIDVEHCPQAFGIALICHCGLRIVNFMCNVPMV